MKPLPEKPFPEEFLLRESQEKPLVDRLRDALDERCTKLEDIMMEVGRETQLIEEKLAEEFEGNKKKIKELIAQRKEARRQRDKEPKWGSQDLRAGKQQERFLRDIWLAQGRS